MLATSAERWKRCRLQRLKRRKKRDKTATGENLLFLEVASSVVWATRRHVLLFHLCAAISLPRIAPSDDLGSDPDR